MANCKVCNYNIDGELALYRTDDLLCDNCAIEKNIKALREKVCPLCKKTDKEAYVNDFNIYDGDICVDCYENHSNSKKIYVLDEGDIGYFLNDEEKRKMKNYSQKLNELTNQHLKKS